jgi:phosphoglycolate phosphatase
MIRGALFDLDGTLADTSEDLIAGANRALAERGVAATLDPRADAPVSGKGGRAMLRLGLKRAGAPWSEADVDALQAPFLEAYEACIAERSRLFPGVEAALGALTDEGWRLAVCTNKPERLARILLGELGVLDRFAALIGADTLPQRKPDPRPVWAAIDRAGAARGASLLVGDTATDREAARAAGIPCVLMDLGLSADGLPGLAAEAVLRDYAGLPDRLERLLPRPPTSSPGAT